MSRSFQDRRREQRASELLGQARRQQAAGQVEEALHTQLNAVELIRASLDACPDNPESRKTAAAALRTLGSLQTQLDQLDAAIASFDECEEHYRFLDEAECAEVSALIADVRARRGFALMRQGRGASAVADVDAAVTTYAELSGSPSARPPAREVARALATASLVLSRFGDPLLAREAADAALRTYLPAAHAGRFTVPTGDVPHLRHAALVAAALHVQHGQPEVALVAANLAVQLLGDGSGETLSHLRTLLARPDELSPEQLAALDGAFTAALCRITRGTPLPGSDLDRLRRTTLAAALTGVTASDELAAIPGKPTRAVVVPAQRCPRPLVPTRARWLAELAVTTLPQAPIEGMRLALEAHYLFAAAARSADSDDQLPAYGPLWVRTLLAASAWFEARAEQAMAVDLACWAAGVADRLMPYAFSDGELAALLHDCVSHHGRLLIACGDHVTGERSLMMARVLAELTGETWRDRAALGHGLPPHHTMSS